MKHILITGATGNIGREVIPYLVQTSTNSKIIVAVRNIKTAKIHFKNYPALEYRAFDFENTVYCNSAFKNIDVLFLLRPPHISEVETYFNPLLQSAKENNIKKIVFLSVQGAEKSKIIPHHRIENLIKTLGFNYIFVRPSYFMQNLTTALLPEIKEHQSITLPSGKGVFNWIDVKNIAEAIAFLIEDFDKYKNKAYEITGSENKNFYDIATLITNITGIKIQYKSINPIRFYFKKRKEGLEKPFALVMTMLHFLPRIEKASNITTNFKDITGKQPTLLKDFIEREKTIFNG
ncbi:NmrA family NAD(P)-binding protein [Xanthomarina gelatinilytica]|uniref:NmrA family NAD(P)-binding protein n=1 Tax=Xanthomarina gelatinilytica TaxID=1137281 RepID=UPI003AA9AE26